MSQETNNVVRTDTISKQDRIFALMGPTGVGKSTFIETATRQDGRTIGHALRSCTSIIRTVRCLHPTDGGPVVFVDTPGFDDTYKSDTEILAMIADWLEKAYRGDVKLAGILYLHRISDNRMSGSILKNLAVFQGICGADVSKSIVLVTTMWDEVPKNVGARREVELESEYWKPLLDNGCRTMRFDGTHRCAWTIVDAIYNHVVDPPASNNPRPVQEISPLRPIFSFGKKRKPERSHLIGQPTVGEPLRIQGEIVDHSLHLKETEAGKTLLKELEKLLRDQEEATRRLREQAGGLQSNELLVEQLNERKAEIEMKIKLTRREIAKLRISMMQRFFSFLRW